MDGIRNIAGTRVNRLEICGRVYTFDVKVLADFAERESYILALKPHPLEVIAGLPPLPAAPTVPVPPDVKDGAEAAATYTRHLAAYQREKAQHEQLAAARARLEDKAWKEATRPRTVTMEEDRFFDQSWHGFGWRLWRALRGNHPEIDSVQAALDLIERAGNAGFTRIAAALDQSEEADLLKNSAGPAGGAGPQPAAASPGPSSTAS